ncbi:efflux RND transporter periplasmic adaptor subunit [uncultured Xylophilus sp.]|uniref:efflux RND transporter periplasmic adaptor subunit n=1 Tax=uncultured Xylophilus sp. TaxID=296832 RepID=UPI0025E2E451|nr:efflux RND transporter periplasmic adaptor subunit [uncultured Xylophilus sp.]
MAPTTSSPAVFRRSATAAFVLCALLALQACGKKQEPAAAEVTPPPDPLVVQVKPEMASNFKVAPLKMADIATVQEVAGRVEANERLVSRIGASVTGRVTEVLADLGYNVRPGQALARVTSPELTQAQLAVLRASSQTSLAARAVERARQLIQADVIGSAELQRRESELAIARAELRAATDQLRLLGVSAGEVQRLRDQGTLATSTVVTAERAGVVIERTVSQGQVAQPGDPLFTVADLSNVWVVGAMPEQAATSVQLGQSVEIDVPALNGVPLTGKVVYVGATVEPETRTVAIRTQVDNAQRALKPQMLATMRISGAPRQVLALPADAVVRENDRDHVFVKTGDNRYRLTPVELGPTSNGLRPLLQGVKEGTEVVTQGAFHLNNERKRAELE